MLKTPSFRLDGKRALVVGASSGIGQACAVVLGEYGADVVIAARRETELRQTKEMVEAVGGRAEVLVMDATKLPDIEALFRKFPPFDIVLNAAGLARHSAAMETREADYDAVFDVNVKAAYFLSKEAAKAMKAGGCHGSIIHISSQMAKVGGVERAVYAATKHALEGMVKSMAIEWGAFGIRINSICPTFIRTALTTATFENPERVKWIEEKIRLGRVGEVQDIMGAAVYLASDASALVTGTSILIDGGWTAG